MVLERLPKIIKIEGGTDTVESEEIILDNYRAAAFLFENAEGSTLTVTINAGAEDTETEAVPFLLKAADETDFEQVGAEGKAITHDGAFVAAVTVDMLSHKEFDRVSVTLESDGDVATVYALLTQPRYTENE